jgi:hypothetical protein
MFSGMNKKPVTKRLYLANDTIPYNPATLRGGWTSSLGMITNKLAKTPTGVSEEMNWTASPITAGTKRCMIKFTSDPLSIGYTFNGTLDICMGNWEDNVSTYNDIRFHIFITAGDTDTVRGTILDQYVGDNINSFPAQASLMSGIVLTTVTALTGDRICIEAGSTTSTNNNNTIHLYCGTTGSPDLTDGDTNVTTRPAWVQFSLGVPLT